MTDAEAPPALEFVFAAHVTVDRPLDLGDVGRGGRRIVPIIFWPAIARQGRTGRR
jgi:hypothetical protein